MKHGIAFRKFSRPTAHRMLMLRNLVTSLFEHEQIKTTLPKARDTARLAEKMITLGKRGDLPSRQRVASFLLKPGIMHKVVGPFAERYAERPGGYTRIHKYGQRQGDNAPHAVLELVDNPRDLRFALTARAVGWETLGIKLEDTSVEDTVNKGLQEVDEVVRNDMPLGFRERGFLRDKTRWNMQKVVKYRGEEGVQKLIKEAKDHADNLLARPVAYAKMQAEKKKKEIDLQDAVGDSPRKAKFWTTSRRAGELVPGEKAGMDTAVLRRAKGALGRPRKQKWFEGMPGFMERPKLGIGMRHA